MNQNINSPKRDLTVENFSKLPIQSQKFFLAGLIDGESNFNVSFRRNRSKASNNPLEYTWNIYTNFFLYQLNINCTLEFFDYVNNTFFNGVGRVRAKNDKTSESDVWVLELAGTENLITYLIPILKETGLVCKNYDYQLFFQVIEIIFNKFHFTRAGFIKCVDLAYKMNQEGKQRTIPKSLILKEVNILFDYYERTVSNRPKPKDKFYKL